MHDAKLVWVTPDAEQMIVDIARVSTNKPKGEPGDRLLKFLVDNKHWSPFEMADMCVEVTTTRDISHQIIRHRSFFFQEFSQRYSEVQDEPVFTKARTQHPTNRQLSQDTENQMLVGLWDYTQNFTSGVAKAMYKLALSEGIAKEVARKILPEGMTPTRLYMKGSVRSWIHYVEGRTYKGTQLEHRLVAESVKEIFKQQFPTISKVIFNV